MTNHDNHATMDVYSGVRWSALAKYASQGVEVLVSLIVARIVAPEAYGLMGMAVVITGFLFTFQSLGFAQALVQRKTINDALLSSLFYLNVVVGLLMAAILVLGAPVFAWMYRDPRVGPIVATLSLIFLISAPGVVPAALLQRRLAFQRLAWVDISVSLVRGVSAISLAVAGWGVWALVWSSIGGVVCRTVVLYTVGSWWPRWLFSWSEVRSVLSFGANLTGFGIFNYFARHADNLIIGAFLGATPLGYYSLAYRILLFPREMITQVMMRVLFPAFSRMQDDDQRLANAYLRVSGAIAFVTFPMMAGLAAVGQPLVEVVLGEKWLPAVPLIWLFAPVGALQSVWVPIGSVFLAKKRADWYFRMGVVQGLLMVSAFFMGLPWGTVGVALCYTLINAVWIPAWWFVGSRLVRGLSIREIVKTLTPYALLSSGMTIVVVVCMQTLIASGLLPSAVLPICILIGIVVYTGGAFALRLQALDELRKLLPRGIAFQGRASCSAGVRSKASHDTII